ncbi:MAG: hypothetical protein H7335_14475 [Massilia sp.]|nr:hypothetical protein [Massilia sp.]
MSALFSRTLFAASLTLAGMLAAPAAWSAEQPSDSAAKVKPKAAAKARPHPKAALVTPIEEPDADISDTTSTEYHCELGNKITLFQNDNDSNHIALRWKKRIHRLERVGTSTGALRFENRAYGLVWIGIPSKGMLLDSKLNRQLANECKNTEQSAPAVVPPAEAQKS